MDPSAMPSNLDVEPSDFRHHPRHHPGGPRDDHLDQARNGVLGQLAETVRRRRAGTTRHPHGKISAAVTQMVTG